MLHGKPNLSRALGAHGAKLPGSSTPQTASLNFHFLSFSFSLRCKNFSCRKITFQSLLILSLNLRKFQIFCLAEMFLLEFAQSFMKKEKSHGIQRDLIFLIFKR